MNERLPVAILIRIRERALQRSVADKLRAERERAAAQARLDEARAHVAEREREVVDARVNLRRSGASVPIKGGSLMSQIVHLERLVADVVESRRISEDVGKVLTSSELALSVERTHVAAAHRRLAKTRAIAERMRRASAVRAEVLAEHEIAEMAEARATVAGHTDRSS